MTEHTKKFFGIIPALVTPFNSDGTEVDDDILVELVEFLIKQGVHGLYPVGTTGEGLLLSMDERKHVIKKVIQIVGNRIPVIPQVGSLTLDETLTLGKFARDEGADAVGVLPPFFYSVPADEIVRYFVDVAEKLAPLRIFLYNIPSNANNDITPKILKSTVAKASNIIGIKDTSKDFGRFEAYISSMPPEFNVIVGADALVFPALVVGGKGAVTAAGNACPELFVGLYNAFVSGNLNEARKLQFRINEVRAIIKQGPPIATYKAVLRLKGINVQGVRRPFRDIKPDEYDSLHKKLDEIGAL